MRIKGKHVVVTGGAHGIGRALCERFHAEGAAHVSVVDLEPGPAAEVAEAVSGSAHVADVGREDQVAAAITEAQSEGGPIDLFCSNAGVGFSDGPGGTAASAPNEIWDACWRINVMAHVYAARALLPAMIERGSGYFLITASAAGLLNQIGDAAYSTTKHAAIGYAEALAITHGDDGIKVSVLAPQAVATRLLAAASDGDEISGFGGNDLDGILSPEEVAKATVAGLAEERFLILPHPQVARYFGHKASDYDRWLAGMRRLRKRVT